jgi:hypothetical protein
MTKRMVFTGFALLCVARAAAAAPIDLPANTPLFIQFKNLEQIDSSGLNVLTIPGGYVGTTPTQGTWGVALITGIQIGAAIASPPHNDISGGGSFYTDDGPGGTAGMITGILGGYQITSATTQTGGFIDLYWHDAGKDTTLGASLAAEADCIAGNTCGPNAATVGAFSTANGGVFLARLLYDTGIVPNDNATTNKSSTDPTTQGASGFADGFTNVDLTKKGAWSDILNGNWFFVELDKDGVRGDDANELRDVRLSNFFNVDVTAWNGTAGSNPTAIGARSNDPARVFTAEVVPEPATLTLLGLGMAGLGYRRRRQKKA